MADNTRDKRPVHAYDQDAAASDWARRARTAFERYQQFFGVPDEM